jgi:micrococcal nuclease
VLRSLFASLLASVALASDFTGHVAVVHDGDTITVEAPGHIYRIRLHGIDCPESRQSGGLEAKQFTTDVALDRTVRVREVDTDKYRRMVGVVTLPDGRVLNEALLRAGHAWWYSKYAADATDLKAMESEARESRRGLWSGSNPLPPWEWRKVRYPVVSKPVKYTRRSQRR